MHKTGQTWRLCKQPLFSALLFSFSSYIFFVLIIYKGNSIPQTTPKMDAFEMGAMKEGAVSKYKAETSPNVRYARRRLCTPAESAYHETTASCPRHPPRRD